jgi:hypothetical protein
MTSPFSACASASESAVLPDAVGPARMSTFGRDAAGGGAAAAPAMPNASACCAHTARSARRELRAEKAHTRRWQVRTGGGGDAAAAVVEQQRERRARRAAARRAAQHSGRRSSMRAAPTAAAGTRGALLVLAGDACGYRTARWIAPRCQISPDCNFRSFAHLRFPYQHPFRSVQQPCRCVQRARRRGWLAAGWRARGAVCRLREAQALTRNLACASAVRAAGAERQLRGGPEGGPGQGAGAARRGGQAGRLRRQRGGCAPRGADLALRCSAFASGPCALAAPLRTPGWPRRCARAPRTRRAGRAAPRAGDRGSADSSAPAFARCCRSPLPPPSPCPWRAPPSRRAPRCPSWWMTPRRTPACS